MSVHLGSNYRPYENFSFHYDFKYNPAPVKVKKKKEHFVPSTNKEYGDAVSGDDRSPLLDLSNDIE